MSRDSIEPRGQGAPSTTVESQLLYDEQLFDLSVAALALRRDLHERKKLADLAQGAVQPVITLTDGQMELWEEASATMRNQNSSTIWNNTGRCSRSCTVQGSQLPGMWISCSQVDRPSARGGYAL